MSGVRTNNVSYRPALAEEILVNGEQGTGLQAFTDFATQLVGSGPLAGAINGATAGVVAGTSLADINAKAAARVMAPGQKGEVPSGADKGTYSWSGSAWIRIGDYLDADTLASLLAQLLAAKTSWKSELIEQEEALMSVIAEIGKLKSLSTRRGIGPMTGIPGGAALQKLNKGASAGMRFYMPAASSLKLSLVPTPKKTRGWNLTSIAGGCVNDGKFGYAFKGQLQADGAALDTLNGTFAIEATGRLDANPTEIAVAVGAAGQAWLGVNAQGFPIASYGSTSPVTLVGTSALTVGANHVLALVLSSSGAKLFANGTQVATSATTFAASGPSIDYTVPFGIGWLGGVDNANQWPGIVSDVAIWSTAAYTANYTVRTAPPTKVAGMRALWRGSDMTDDAREAAGNSLNLSPARAGAPMQAAPVSNPTFGPGKFYGTKAVSTAGGVMEAPAAAINVASGAFAVGCLARLPSSFPGTSTYVMLGQSNVFWIASFSDGFVRATWGTGAGVITTNVSIRDNLWHDFKLSIGTGGGKLFIDGVLAGSSATTYSAAGGVASPATPFGIGRIGGNNAFQWPGQIAEVVTWDEDHYPAAFTPPTEPLPVIGHMTSLFPLDGDGNNVLVGGSMSLSADTTGPNWDETLDGMDVWVSDVVGSPMYRQY